MFIGEGCDPTFDAEPALAINGLVLYCAPDSTGVYRWSPKPPPSPTPASPRTGSECDPADAGQVTQGANSA